MEFLDFLRINRIWHEIKRGRLYVNNIYLDKKSEVEELPDNITVNNILSLEGSEVKELPKKLIVRGDLWLNEHIVKLPSCLKFDRLFFSTISGYEIFIKKNKMFINSKSVAIGNDIKINKLIENMNICMAIKEKIKQDINKINKIIK